MPERLAVAEPTDRPAVFDDVRDHRNFRRHLGAAPRAVVLDAVLLGDQRSGIEFELAELAGERHVLRVVHRLVAKAQHEIVEPRGADRVAISGAERRADIDPADIGAEPRGERADRDAHHSLRLIARPSRRPLRGLLRMTLFLNSITNLRHPEEARSAVSKDTITPPLVFQ